MTVSTPTERRYQQARERVAAIRGFYIHLLVFAIINAFLFLLNLITSPGNWWFYWPLLGWGIALALHGIIALGTESWWGKEWEERKIHDFMEKDDKPELR